MNDPRRQVETAITTLGTMLDTEVCAVSALVWSRPLEQTKEIAVSSRKQADFVNAVAAILTLCTPLQLLDQLHDIEMDQGRVRGPERWGPRVIDLDILVYADQVIDTPTLTVPHRHLHERDFVLGPLMEIAPKLNVPGVGLVEHLARRCNLSALRLVSDHGP